MKHKIFFFVLFCGTLFAAAAQQKVVKVACVGNSITYGSGLQDRQADSYPSVLGRMLGEGKL